jgi:hypothetical protein
VQKVGVTASVFVLAIGAILAFAVTATVEGVDLVVVGWILMTVGLVGVVLSLLSWETWGGFGRTTSRRRVVVDEDPFFAGTRRRTAVIERDDLIP